MCILVRKQISHNTWGYCVNNVKGLPKIRYPEREREREIDRMEEKERQPYRD